MAQNYEIDIKRFNGQDYDTLLPTPASHASTHQANGSDPLTLQEGNYGASSIPTSAYQNASVTRAKLAQDAMYSPNVLVSASRALTADDVGKTLFASGANNDCTFTLDSTANGIMPSGAEIAFCWINRSSPVSISISGVNVVHAGDGRIDATSSPVTFKLSEWGTMVALKKYSSTGWLLTGNVEVSE